MADKKPPQQPGLGVQSDRTSSAATIYNDANQDWLKNLGSGVKKWMSHPTIGPIDLGAIFKNLKDAAKEIKAAVSDLTKLKSMFSLENITNSIKGFFNRTKEKIKVGFLGPLMVVKNKIVGALGTAKGQGLALFGLISGAVLGGGILLGAGPETITGMLRVSQLVYTLNWKESDEEIEKALEGSTTSLYSAVGQTIGTGLASFVTGGVFKFPRVQINMTKITILYRALNEEARDQMINSVKNLARTAFFTGVRMMVKIVYRSVRKLIKKFAKDNPNSALLNLVPGGAKTLEQWGSGGEPWSLSIGVQKFVEKIQENPVTKNFGILVEELIESFAEGIQDFLPELVRQPIA